MRPRSFGRLAGNGLTPRSSSASVFWQSLPSSPFSSHSGMGFCLPPTPPQRRTMVATVLTRASQCLGL